MSAAVALAAAPRRAGLRLIGLAKRRPSLAYVRPQRRDDADQGGGSPWLMLIESCSKKDGAELCGRTGNNRVVNFPGSPRLIGRMREVRITAARPHSLRGELLNAK